MQTLKIILIIALIIMCIALIYYLCANIKWSLFVADRRGGVNFEKFVMRVFESLGYKCQTTRASGDQGIDLIIKKHFKKIGVQVKCYNKPVGNGAVQEAVAGKKYYNLDRVMVVCNRTFTRSAINLAKANKVQLIDRRELKKLIRKAKRKQ